MRPLPRLFNGAEQRLLYTRHFKVFAGAVSTAARASRTGKRVLPMASAAAPSAAPSLPNRPSFNRTDPGPRDDRTAAGTKRWRLLGPWRRPDRQEVLVQTWKDAWVRGAKARWAGTPTDKNPYDARTTRGVAWFAGWRWADRQPDRRAARPIRLAHPHRRNTDVVSRLIRHAPTEAVGLSMVALAGWVWHMRGRRRANVGY